MYISTFLFLPVALLLSSLALIAAAGTARAAEWYVTPEGRSTAHGTEGDPWDIGSALGGKQKIVPGDTLWLRKGTYKRPFQLLGYGYEVRLVGAAEAPIQVRAFPGERVTIDGGLNVQPPSTHLYLRDLELTVSEPRPAKPIPPDPSYRGTNRPWGGLNIYSGEGCEYINLVIHDNSQGVSFWTGAQNSELYGCIIYDNGWAGTDRGHGHAIYTQNKDGIKKITDCIFTGGYGYTLHAYGQGGDVDNYLVQGNIAYHANTFLLGGYKPSHGIRVLENVLYGVPMQLGYSAPYNEDCEVRDNVIVNGSLSIKKFREVKNEGNLVLPEGAARPRGSRVIFLPNRFDPGRANLVILNWEKQPEIGVDPGPFLKVGDHYQLMDPRDFYGKPVLNGVYDGKKIQVRLAGEFAAFIILRR